MRIDSYQGPSDWNYFEILNKMDISWLNNKLIPFELLDFKKNWPFLSWQIPVNLFKWNHHELQNELDDYKLIWHLIRH